MIALVAWGALGPAASAGPQPFSLRFLTQPADAEQGAVITSVPFDPRPSIQPIQVEVVGPNGTRATNSTAEITMEIGTDPTPNSNGVLSGTTKVKAVAGVASFGNLRISPDGFGYQLRAQSSKTVPALSNRFDIWEVVEDCQANKSCRGVVSDSEMSGEVSGTSATAGLLLLSLGATAVNTLDCGDSANHAPSVVSVDSRGFTGTKTATLRVTKAVDQLQANNGVVFYQVCYESDNSFEDRNGNLVTTGLLPDCDKQPQPPCVQSKNKTNAGDVLITLLLPAADPRFR
ncbi:MAG TPA: hypothetical protein VHF25_02015 [Nitriliruptorales bacterium]|nr:hypothetical protein [Nitriliruptorales bacterium]